MGLLQLDTDADAIISQTAHFLLLPADDFFKVHKLKPNLKWRQAFEMYLKTMPPYYLLVNECNIFNASFSLNGFMVFFL